MNCCPLTLPSCNATQSGFTLGTPEPHYIPGYLGYVPQAKYRPGHTFGVTSHRILIDPCIHMSPRSMLTNVHPDYCADDFGRPGLGPYPFLQSQMTLANSRINSFGRQQYQPNMTPGYTGYVPCFQTILGHTYSPACNQALARFEQDQWRDRLFKKDLQALDGWRFCYKSKPWESPEVIRPAVFDLQEFVNPSCQQNDLMPIRGSGCCARYSSNSTPAPMPMLVSSGGGGCASCSGSSKNRASTASSCGSSAPFRILSSSHLNCEYAGRRAWGVATEQILNKDCGVNAFKPVNKYAFVKPVQRVQQLYKDCEGMLPNYNGHVPGEQFRIGRTYGNATRNARRALEQPSHAPLCFPLPRD